jgi:hypothetical protein
MGILRLVIWLLFEIEWILELILEWVFSLELLVLDLVIDCIKGN